MKYRRVGVAILPHKQKLRSLESNALGNDLQGNAVANQEAEPITSHYMMHFVLHVQYNLWPQ